MMSRGRTPSSLPGISRVPGPKREYYVESTGQTISKRSYDTLRRGVTNEAFARERRLTGIKNPMERYNQQLARLQQQKAKEGIIVTKGELRASAELRQLRKDLRTKSNSPTGRKAQALVKLGYRDEKWTHEVGMTAQLRAAGQLINDTTPDESEYEAEEPE